MAFNPDGKTIVSACYGGTIKVWDAGTLAPKIDLSGPKLTVAPFSAGTLELKAEKQNAHAQEYGQSITDVKFSPDGTKIVSCGVDRTIKVWDAGRLDLPDPKPTKTDASFLLSRYSRAQGDKGGCT